MSTPETVAPKLTLEPSGTARGVTTAADILKTILSFIIGLCSLNDDL